jgi:ArsR family transcriptional regulator
MKKGSLMKKNGDSVCKSFVLHEDILKKVEASMPEEKALFRMADFFKVLGDLTRIKILQALCRAELCVCDLAATVNVSQSAISHQLRILRQTNFVKNRKEGKVVFYSLYDEHIRSVVDLGMQHINEK